ncbi:unannotated protein [freshwater metagenome]|uniref:Unannotated protein n=1 Tax=freshwater metagenome TaxID=449393 RepID=A0A6J7GRV9_9ZZZZ|nr:hypothetical protein [Actinomycetota bacterium]
MTGPGHASNLMQTLQGRRHAAGPDGPILTPIDAVDAIEAAMAMGEEEHGERWRKRPVLHHVKKGLGHALSAGPRGDGIDDDSGHPHLVLAATRMVLAVAVYLASREA